MVPPRVTRHPVQLRLEITHAGFECLFPFDEPLRFGTIHVPARRAARELVDVARDSSLVLRQLFGLPDRIIEITRRPLIAVLVEQASRFLQSIESRRTLRHATIVRAGGRATHRVRRVLQSARTFRELLAILRVLARQPLELTRHLLRLLGELTLRAAAATARLTLLATHRVPQPLVLLLQPAREVLQLLGRLVDLIVGLLLLRPTFDRLVLVP